MQYITNTAVAIAIVIIAVLGYMSAQKWIKNNAIDECNKLAVSIKPGDYVKPLFVTCMQEKGYDLVNAGQ